MLLEVSHTHKLPRTAGARLRIEKGKLHCRCSRRDDGNTYSDEIPHSRTRPRQAWARRSRRRQHGCAAKESASRPTKIDVGIKQVMILRVWYRYLVAVYVVWLHVADGYRTQQTRAHQCRRRVREERACPQGVLCYVTYCDLDHRQYLEF